jgi:AAA domain, putative AbiEii toxin, Type IV TA system/AAA domain
VQAQGSVLITGLRLTNVRGFRELDVRMATAGDPTTPRPITLVIGKNGTNKSTLLRAIALCLADPTEASSMLSQPLGSMVRAGAEVATIEMDVVSPEGVTTTLRREVAANGSKDYLAMSDVPRSPPVFVCGYGAGRGTFGSDSGREYRVDDACASLYDYGRELIHPELTLRRLRDYLGTSRYEHTLTGIKRVLDLNAEDRIELQVGGGVQLAGPTIGSAVPLDGWADGYRLTFLWLLDFYGRAMRADQIDPGGSVRGIVLVDEVDQHLHPSLQAAIMPRLAELLPAAQIVATTHSPLVALGADPSELVVLQRGDDEVVVETDVPDYRGYSAEDMLADERLFDSAVYAPDTEQELTRYWELIGKGPSHLSRQEERELATLVRRMQAQPLPPSVNEKVVAAMAEIDRRSRASRRPRT